ncbi:MAG: lipoate--protein ligase family protein [Parachlamydiaceae bacterium]|nr:lipoate--protein ligase family protein [Parachlamydiaceae bacterium]
MLHLLQLKNVPIFEQLKIEEALLRADDRNWCIINSGSPTSIVMGISGKYEEHVCPYMIDKLPIPVIRRFSGGGTVIVDEQTFFFTLIGNKDLLDVPCYPDELLKWTEKLYAPAFEGLNFSLRDNDYVIGNKKFGGNAQYICKNRWLHHSSLLWDYEKSKMDYLLMPKKVPAYRMGRDHTEFLCRLNTYFNDSCDLQDKILKALRARFTLTAVDLKAIDSTLSKTYRCSTQLI